jgi:hypothetical protein
MSVAPSHTLQATANVATRFIESRGNFKILLQLLENMVAREGAEAPTPAFSGPILTVIASTLLRPKFQMSSDSILLIR